MSYPACGNLNIICKFRVKKTGICSCLSNCSYKEMIKTRGEIAKEAIKDKEQLIND